MSPTLSLYTKLTWGFSTRRSLPLELLTAILIPLPYLVRSFSRPLSVADTDSKHSVSAEALGELEQVAPTAFPVTIPNSSLFEACALASCTLILLGALGCFMIRNEKQGRRRSSSTTAKIAASPLPTARIFTWTYLKSLFIRIAATTLPFVAAAEIGGVRTGIFLLAGVADGLVAPDVTANVPPRSKWQKIRHSHKWICGIFLASLVSDFFMVPYGENRLAIVRGYAALVKSTIFLRSPLPATVGLQSSRPNSPLISSIQEATTTLIAGLILGAMTLMTASVLTTVPALDLHSTTSHFLVVGATAVVFLFSTPVLLRSSSKAGLAFGLGILMLHGSIVDGVLGKDTACLILLTVLVYLAVRLDSRVQARPRPATSHLMRKAALRDAPHVTGSRFTTFWLEQTEGWPLLHSILSNQDSRRIAYFMMINLTFMLVQTFYSLVSGSLGLLSDSIHMLFDCVGLFAGLVAAVMSKWPPNRRFPYGYGKIEVLSGLGNGIFLMIISVEIIWESFERVLEGAELKRMNELLLVSIGGLLVNLIGLLFTGHHHHHGHSHAHGHDHSHANVRKDSRDDSNGHKQRTLAQVPGLESNTLNSSHPIATPDIGPSPHGHRVEHSHSPQPQGHANENMAGIYLHILADTMGSVAVIVSTLLTKYTHWYGWDPIASCIIAVLIIFASYPLVLGSAKQLLLTLPEEVEYALRDTIQGISEIRGVAGYAVPRFWLDERRAEDENFPHHVAKDCNLHVHDSLPHPDACTHLHHDQPEGLKGGGTLGMVAQTHDELRAEENRPHHHHHHDHDNNHAAQSNVHGVHHQHLERTQLLGVIHIMATARAQLEDVRMRVETYFKERNMDVLVQVEREGSSRCWCGGMQAGSGGNDNTRSSAAM